MPFVIFTLPRSRSKWLSQLLSFPPHIVGHDTVITCDTMSDFTEPILDGTLDGTVETGAGLAWRLIARDIPKIKMAVIFRRKRDVWRSLRKKGVRMDMGELWDRHYFLQEIAAQPGVFSLTYDRLNDFPSLSSLSFHCLGEHLPKDRWTALQSVNIQIDMPERLRTLVMRTPALQKLRESVLGELSSMRRSQLH